MDKEENKIEELTEEKVTDNNENLTEIEESAQQSSEAVAEVTEEKPKPVKHSGSKGNKKVLFPSETVTAFSAVANTEELNLKYRRKVAIMMVLVMAGFTVLSLAIRFWTFTPSFLPAFLNVDFSSFPELIISIAYGPVFGVIVVIVKNLLYIAIKLESLSIPAIIDNIVINSLFVFVSGIVYSSKMFKLENKNIPKKKDMRRTYILLGGFVGSVVVAIATFFLAKFVTFPILFKFYGAQGYNEGSMVFLYQQALDKLNNMLPNALRGIITDIDSLTKGIIIYNVPHTFAKYFASTILAVLFYNLISPLLHFRKIELKGYNNKNNNDDFEI